MHDHTVLRPDTQRIGKREHGAPGPQPRPTKWDRDKLSYIHHHRYGVYYDDQPSRDMLVALLRCGLRNQHGMIGDGLLLLEWAYR
jgi:hypothetical protein